MFVHRLSRWNGVLCRLFFGFFLLCENIVGESGKTPNSVRYRVCAPHKSTTNLKAISTHWRINSIWTVILLETWIQPANFSVCVCIFVQKHSSSSNHTEKNRSLLFHLFQVFVFNLYPSLLIAPFFQQTMFGIVWFCFSWIFLLLFVFVLAFHIEKQSAGFRFFCLRLDNEFRFFDAVFFNNICRSIITGVSWTISTNEHVHADTKTVHKKLHSGCYRPTQHTNLMAAAQCFHSNLFAKMKKNHLICVFLLIFS